MKMKRSLWIAIGVIALLFLVFLGLSPSREGFISVPTKIDPSYVLPESEVNMIISNLPSDFAQTVDAEQKAIYDAETAAIAAAPRPAGAVPAARKPFTPSTAEDRKRNIIFVVSLFKKYLNEKGRTGEKVVVDDTDIDAFIATMPSHSSDKAVRTILQTFTRGVGTAVTSEYAKALAAVGQSVGYGSPATGPTGGAAGGAAGSASSTGATGGTGATGAAGVSGAAGAAMAAAAAAAGVAGNAASTPPGAGGVATTTGNTTGGSSTSSLGPNNLLPTTSGMGGRNVFGPVFTSLGMGGGPQGDSSKTNKYPQLLGPDPKPSTRIEGVGVVNPSKSYTLANDGSLPSSAQTGSDENSRFLPHSRVPGDQEGTDPYRVSQSYLSSRGSYKNEPVPFLTDFSAFQK